jgi:hypothetical protein
MGGFAGGLLSSLQLGMEFSRQRDQQQRQRDLMQLRGQELELQRDALAQKRLDSAFDVRKQEDQVAQWSELNRIADETNSIARFSAETGRMELLDNRRKVAKEDAEEAAGSLVNNLESKGWLNALDGYRAAPAAIRDALQGGKYSSDRAAIQLLNQAPRPDGVVFDSIDREVVNGQPLFFIRGTNKDGSSAVLTELGSTASDDKAVGLTLDQAVGLIGDQAEELIAGVYSREQLSAIFAAQGLADDMADRQAGEILEERSKRVAISGALATGAGQNPDGTPALGAFRAYKGSLASIQDPNERNAFIQKVGADLGIEFTPATLAPASEIVGATAEPRRDLAAEALGVPYSANSAAEARGSAQREVTRLDSQITDLERRAEQATGARKERIMGQITELDAQRQELVQRTNTQSLEAATARIKDLAAKRDKAAPARRGYWQEQIDAATQEKRELERSLGMVTPAMEAQAYKDFSTKVEQRLSNLSPDEVEKLVAEGKLSFTADDISAAKARLDEAGVTTIEELKTKLPTREQLKYYALLSVIAPDATQRESYRTELRNLTETGVASASALELGELRARQQEAINTANNTALEARKWATSQDDAVRQRLVTITENVSKAFLEEDPNRKGNFRLRSGGAGAANFFTQTYPALISEWDAAPPALREGIAKQAGRGISLAANSLAGNIGGGSFVDRWKDWIGATSSASYAASGTDFDLNRIEVAAYRRGPNGEKIPASFRYKSRTGGQAGRTIRASEIPDERIYNALVQAAEVNERNKNK